MAYQWALTELLDATGGNMVSKKQSKLYCICNQAIATSICEECPKGRALKPDETYCCPTWPRRIDKYGKKGDIIFLDIPPESA
jgi:hypothetical protein